ncbi:uncharacterized protein DUF1344 [Breoghania corrubedonensis]|uniref:Uncharacterized protein DUF1344 n=1 Tax=Breoghania corrubedonensis TaxID=665038 RepID=A0A2T5V1B5_9HYPH|nr:DUF1344 domain-containing protein [Breoghania corrubedonensis]PTW57526.1 uncharacterized protein DUF1344 [Breoghania corrubedonensis]
MRRVIVSAAAVALIASATTAFAAQTTTGTVKAFNHKSMTLTLKDGVKYRLPAGWKNPGLKTGEKVAVTYDVKNGKRTASAVEIRK